MSGYNHLGCSCCGGPFNGGNCPSCGSVGFGNEFVCDPNPYSYNETPNFYNQPPQHQYEMNSCEFCRNDAHYGYNCPPQVPFVYNQDSCFNKNSDNFPQTSPSFQQKYLYCENCGGPHETFQCQTLNQNFYETNHCYTSNSFSFNQSQPLQFLIIHQPPQATSMEILQDRENVINSVQTFLRKFNRYFFFETPKVLLLAWDKVSEIKDAFRNKQYKPEDIQELFRKLFNDVQYIHEELTEYINTSSWNHPAFYNNNEDNDEEYTIAITPVLPTEEPDNSLSIRDEHLSTILKTESDKVIKFSVKDLVPILNDSTSIDDDSFSIEDIDYVEASPPDSEPVSLEEVKDEILHVKLLNVNLLIAKIESLNDNLTPDRVLKSPSSFPIPVEDNTYEEPQVHVPNVLPTHLTLMLDSDFIPLDDSLGSYLEVSFPSGTRNKIFDPVIFFEVQSKNFLSRDTFYISFICDPLCPVIETLLPFSSENEVQVFNPGILSSNLLSHRGKITSDFSENPMMISGGDIPFLDVLFLHFYPP
nr:hypothetical protein [Tanacetum cinerariifolium]